MNICKTLLFSFYCLLVLSSTSLKAQQLPKLTPAQWREDLKFLSHAVHNKYSNLFYNVTAQQFDSAVKAIDAKIGSLNDIQMRVEFVKLVAMFKVGHTTVRQRFGNGNNLQPWVNNFPVRFELFSDGLFIKSIQENHKEAAGGKILRIGNTDVREAMMKIRPLVSFENEQGFRSMLPFYLNVPEFLYSSGIIPDASTVKLVYLKNGKENSIELNAKPVTMQAMHGNIPDNAKFVDAFQADKKPLWLRQTDRLRYFEYLPESKTIYVRHSAVQDDRNETIQEFFSKAFRFADSVQSDKFILDIRTNGGGNNYLNKPVITGIIQSKSINRKGHFFVITGKATFSAAQNLTNELEKYTEAIFAGEPTSENVNFYGDTRTEVLPNSLLNINLSWLWWQNMDPRDKRQWTSPELAAEMSSGDYIAGRDPVMEIIMNYKTQEPVESRIAHFITNNDKSAAFELARNYMKDPANRYIKNDLEHKINNAGYAFMSQDKLKEANELLGINVELFPNSANVYDSYAESFMKMGNNEQAIIYYKKAIEKDPSGVTGDNARNMLKQIPSKKGF